MQTTQTPASSSVPAAQHTVKNVEDALSADATGEMPEVGELGLEDIIDDGSSTQIMMRGELDLKNVVKVEASSPSPLDALAMTIPAKGNTLTSAKIDPSVVPASAAKKPPLPPMKVVTAAPPPPTPMPAPAPPAPELVAAPAAATAAPPAVATMLSAQSPLAPSPKIPKPANTAPIVDLDSDDLIEQQTRIMERTQPFDRNRLFGAPRSNEPAAAEVSTPKNEKSTTQQSPWRPSPVPRELTAPASALPQTRQGGFAAPSQRPQTPSASFTPAPLPSVVIAEPPQAHHRPASIAPLAIDLAPVQMPPMARVPEATQKLPAMRVMPRANNKLNIIAGAIAGGVAICAAAIIGVVSLSSDDGGSASTSKSQPTVAAKPREAQQGSARSAVIETPETTPARAASPLAARDEDGIPLSSPNALPSAPGAKGFAAQDDRNEPAPTPRMSTGSSNANAGTAKKPAAVAAKAAPEPTPATQPAAQPAAAPAPAPAPAPRAAAATSTTGTIEVPANMMTVMVDGDYRRVQGGRIVVSCGKHRVNAGRGMRDVDVPCGGSVSAQ